MGVGSDATLKGQSRVYTKQQPAGETLNGQTITTEQVIDGGGLLNILGELAVNSVDAAIKASFAIAPGSPSSNICNVTITLTDGDGNAITAGPVHVDVCLSDAATGLGLTATAASGTVTPTTGTLLSTYVAKKALYIQSDSAGTGTIVLAITDSAKTGFYIVVAGLIVPYVSRQLVTGDYG